MVELIPVIELTPGTFATEDRPSPRVRLSDAPEAWQAYWRASLEDAGVVGLSAIVPGSWLVELDQLTDSDLELFRRVLAILMSDVELDDLDTAGPLCGGYWLATEKVHLEPGCCGDLTDLAGWFEALDYVGTEWRQLWIGHPWTHVRSQGDGLEFAVPSETKTPVSFEPPLIVQRTALRQAAVVAEERRRAFGEKVRLALETMVPESVIEKLATILVAGHS